MLVCYPVVSLITKMCSEVLSWREESWWERKSIPLGSHSFSPRQLFLLAIFGGVGDLMSVPIPLTIFGIIYLGKLIPVLALLAIAVAIGIQRIKMIPLEFQLFFRMTKKKVLTPPVTVHSSESREEIKSTQWRQQIGKHEGH
jgi:hypothetical protein